MPTYDYRCKTCDAQFEVVQSITAKTLKRCPKKDGPEACVSPGKGEVAKVFAAPGITFKGDGFYKTDSSSPKKAKASTSSNGDGDKSDSSTSDSPTKTDSDKSTSSSTSEKSSD